MALQVLQDGEDQAEMQKLIDDYTLESALILITHFVHDERMSSFSRTKMISPGS